MERLAPRGDDRFHDNIIKPSIMRTRLTPQPPSRDVSFSNYLQTEANHSVQCAQDSEISIFDAEKYFNGVLTNPNSKNIHEETAKQAGSSVSNESYGRNCRTRSFQAKPTASSEASWNSQSGLLTNPPGLAPVSIRSIQTADDRFSKKAGATRNWFLRGSICPCTGRKSVNVKPPRIVQLHRISSNGGCPYSSSPNSARSFVERAQLDKNKLMMTSTNPNPSRNLNLGGLHRDHAFLPNPVAAGAGAGAGDGFTFPILSEKSASFKRTINIRQPIVLEDDAGETPRDSIEVFQPRESPKSRRASYDEDMCSEASSDLFEIESFSTTATQTFPFHRRDSHDDPAGNFNVRRLWIAASSVAIAGLDEDDVEEPVTPSIAPTECYPPSEVSVDWSVTTAEGAGFSVSASELGYAALRKPPKFGSDADERKRKGNGGLLRSCRCEKAVNVGPAPIRYQTEIRRPNPRRSHE